MYIQNIHPCPFPFIGYIVGLVNKKTLWQMQQFLHIPNGVSLPKNGEFVIIQMTTIRGIMYLCPKE